jgi:D-arabinose 1-dehydrogenase-like Zn-dependent alcohol dehydrogenase
MISMPGHWRGSSARSRSWFWSGANPDLDLGVCRTDLHLAEGDLPPKRPQITPGHEIVGIIDKCGDGAERFSVGQRVGVPWLGGTDGTCGYCRSGRENLCLRPRFSGWDVDGGYTHRQCATGGRLGIYGFGGSARLAAQIALHEGTRVHVLTRGELNQQLARAIGVDSLTPREREVVALMAEGCTNAGISRRQWLTERTVETHVGNIMAKFGLASNVEEHRRVLTVLTYLGRRRI